MPVRLNTAHARFGNLMIGASTSAVAVVGDEMGGHLQIHVGRSGWRILAFVAVALVAANVGATDYYVAPTGGSDAAGRGLTYETPFATFSHAISLAMPGDTIYALGGTYNLNASVSIGGSKDGTAANPYRLFAFPGETPIFDFRSEPYSSSNNGMRGISLNGDYWHIKGLTIQYAADNGIAIGGSNNIVEQVVARQNQDSGFQISGGNRPSNNLLLNCDSYGNFDFGATGENADGFAAKFRDLGPGNVISGARAWNNADDGFDFWEAANGVTVANSWAFHNGIASVFADLPDFDGDGNGLKLGKDSGTHVLTNLLVWGHPANGVDVNGNATEPQTFPAVPHGVTVYNVTSALNSGPNFRFDENPLEASPPTNHILMNNVSFNENVIIYPGNTTDRNTFAGPGGTPAGLGVAAADFLSTTDPVTSNGLYHPAGSGGDRSGTTVPIHATGPAVAPRLSDGSLPPLEFMRLAPGSQLIDAGLDVGLPFNGLAPDVGWFETSEPVVMLPGDFNGDKIVDAADYIDWRQGLGTLYDEDDYNDWRTHFGETLSGSGAGSSAAIPEPGPMWLAIVGTMVAVAVVSHRRIGRGGKPNGVRDSPSMRRGGRNRRRRREYGKSCP